MSTSIPYLNEVWNVTTGCGDDMVSPGCLNCYARRMFGRRLWKCETCQGTGRVISPRGVFNTPSGIYLCPTCGGCRKADFRPTFHADRLDQPLHWRKPRVVGVSFMGDLFHEGITGGQINAVLDRVNMAPQHTYLLLTKRIERAHDIFRAVGPRNEHSFLGGPAPNLWLGTTVCTQAEADRNIPILLATPAAKRWVSLEPMLSAVDLVHGGKSHSHWYPWDFLRGQLTQETANLGIRYHDDTPKLDWVVLGGETGPGARPMQPEWALDVYRQCKAAGVAFWFKQWGSVFTGGGDHDVPAMVATHELPAARP